MMRFTSSGALQLELWHASSIKWIVTPVYLHHRRSKRLIELKASSEPQISKVGQATTASIRVRVRVLRRDPNIQDTTASAIRITCLATFLLSECTFWHSPSA